jgi:hypothetical protein
MFDVSKQRRSLKYWMHKRFWKFHVSLLINVRFSKTRMDTFDYVNDPIAAAQVRTLAALLGDQWSKKTRYGFLVAAGRFVDEWGADRTEDLARMFETQTEAGRRALRRSLEELLDRVGSPLEYEQNYPVYINDPIYGSVGAFPQLHVLGIETFRPTLYRVMDSKAVVFGTEEPITTFISREGKLPHMPVPADPVLRAKPTMYWCAYESYDSPSATQSALQILPEWHSDCKLRATLSAKGLDGLVFVAFNGDTAYRDPKPGESKSMAFAGYCLELKAQDNPSLPGGGIQVGVVGSPQVLLLEEWNDSEDCWSTVWSAQPSA